MFENKSSLNTRFCTYAILKFPGIKFTYAYTLSLARRCNAKESETTSADRKPRDISARVAACRKEIPLQRNVRMKNEH